MTRLASILALFVALFALLSPTMATAATALNTAPSGAVVTATDDGAICIVVQAHQRAELPHLKPCEKQGGKRLLPCHTDLGVCSIPIELISTFYSDEPVAASQAAWRQALREADLPPPRVYSLSA